MVNDPDSNITISHQMIEEAFKSIAKFEDINKLKSRDN